ncbi:MAG TPA: hypothetical protein VMS56_13435 [Thermoanaerobaculia bacterium]|nr:hypothetical protein [Thermoanaerobaculia bacterium]
MSRDHRTLRALLFGLVALGWISACARPTELTERKAAEILEGASFEVAPVYAEVPQVVRWGPESPKDDYDELAVRTLRNLEREGLVRLIDEGSPESDVYVLRAETTPEGFRILGTVPSARGPALRARIAEKRIDGLRNFIRHPDDPTVARAELVWHYERPTRFYDLFETKIDKPLDRPFASLVSFRWEDGSWHFAVIAEKVDPSN